MNQALSLSPSPEVRCPLELLDDLAPVAERPDGWGRRPQDAAHEALLRIRAEAEADVLCKLLNLFALQGWLPAEVRALRDGDWLRIDLRLPGLPRQRAEVMAQRMRSMVSVAAVELAFRDI